MKRGIKSGSVAPSSTLLKFSEDAVDEQKHAIRIADEKVALAIQAYDLVNKEHSLIFDVNDNYIVLVSFVYSSF